MRRATGGIYRTVKKQRRRQERRAAKIRANDKAVTERHRDRLRRADRRRDRRASPLVRRRHGRDRRACSSARAPATSARAATSRSTPSTTSSARTARRVNHARRDARTDLTGRRALLTGGRAKIGMYIALRLLRDGAHTTITTRFPNDAVRRFKAMPDSADWLHRLRIVGIDLRDPAQVVALADSVAAAGPARHPDQQRRADRAPLARVPTRSWSRPSPRRCPPASCPPPRSSAPSAAAPRPRRRAAQRPRRDARRRRTSTALALVAGSASPGAHRGRHGDRRRRPGARPARTPTAGSRRSTRSTRSSCSRCSCATRPRRSS